MSLSPSSLAIKNSSQHPFPVVLPSTTSYLIFITFIIINFILKLNPSNNSKMNWLTRKKNTRTLRTKWIKHLQNWPATNINFPFYFLLASFTFSLVDHVVFLFDMKKLLSRHPTVNLSWRNLLISWLWHYLMCTWYYRQDSLQDLLETFFLLMNYTADIIDIKDNNKVLYYLSSKLDRNFLYNWPC
jgi:hypothetical protein